MAMNAETLSTAIRTKVKEKMRLEELPPSEFFDAIAEAVVKHITENAEVDTQNGVIS